MASAEEIVLAKMPTITSGPQSEIRIMIIESPKRPPCWPPSRRHVAPRMTAIPMYTMFDKTTANIVPKGSDFCALRSSPEMLAPAIIPVTAGKNTEKMLMKFSPCGLTTVGR